MMKKTLALIDFDKTIISVDSFIYILKKERWFFNIRIIWKVIEILIAKLNHKDELEKRSSLKYILLSKYQFLPEEEKQKIVCQMKQKINVDVIMSIRNMHPDLIVIASASETSLIDAVTKDVLNVNYIIANDYIADGASFRTCYGEEKAKRFKEAITDYQDYDIYVWTDSLSDKPIIDLAKEYHHVR